MHIKIFGASPQGVLPPTQWRSVFYPQHNTTSMDCLRQNYDPFYF